MKPFTGFYRDRVPGTTTYYSQFPTKKINYSLKIHNTLQEDADHAGV